MNALTESGASIWTTLKRITDTLLATTQNRLELFAVELKEEKCRLIEAILWAAAVAAFGMMTLTLVTFTLVALFWENGRFIALVGLSALYLTGAALSWRALRLRLKNSSPFASTLNELKKDRSCLETEK